MAFWELLNCYIGVIDIDIPIIDMMHINKNKQFHADRKTACPCYDIRNTGDKKEDRCAS